MEMVPVKGKVKKNTPQFDEKGVFVFYRFCKIN